MLHFLFCSFLQEIGFRRVHLSTMYGFLLQTEKGILSEQFRSWIWSQKVYFYRILFQIIGKKFFLSS